MSYVFWLILFLLKSSSKFSSLLIEKKNILKNININIKDSKNEAEKILKDIALKEALIKQLENDKTDFLKLSSFNTEKLSKILKDKGNEINKLNNKIEES